MDTAPITAAQIQQLRLNGLASVQSTAIDHYPVVQVFTPDGAATWLLTELDAADDDTVFGLCDPGMGCP